MAWVVLLGSAFSFSIGMLLPAPVIGRLRLRMPVLAQEWDTLNAAFPALNPLHVLWYAWIALLWWLVTRRQYRWAGALLLVGMSALGEVLQLWVPGRNARIGDALNDMLGIGIGIALGALILRLAHGCQRVLLQNRKLAGSASRRPEEQS
jgi:hypothetical protein